MMKYITNLYMTLLSFCYIKEPVTRKDLTNVFCWLSYEFSGENKNYNYIYHTVMSKALHQLLSSGHVNRLDHGKYKISYAGIRTLKRVDRKYGLPPSIKPDWLDDYPTPEDDKDIVLRRCSKCQRVLKTKFRKAKDPGNPGRYRVDM